MKCHGHGHFWVAYSIGQTGHLNHIMLSQCHVAMVAQPIVLADVVPMVLGFIFSSSDAKSVVKHILFNIKNHRGDAIFFTYLKKKEFLSLQAQPIPPCLILAEAKKHGAAWQWCWLLLQEMSELCKGKIKKELL